MMSRLRQFLRTTLILVALVVLSGPIYVRLAPLDPAQLHQMGAPRPVGDYPGANRFLAVRHLSQAGTLGRLDAIILATPRTRVLAGSVDDGHISYVTRSLVWGFPDITNVWQDGETLYVDGFAIFGRSDLGVNRARIEGWLQALGQS